VANHLARAKLLLEQAQNEMSTADDPDSIEVALIAALTANAEATLALVEQQRLDNESGLFMEAAYNPDVNPTDMTVHAWAEDLYRRIKE
jgi:hypothetical protein